MDKTLQAIREESALCVKCGKCLTRCPTYQVSHHEAESPRGRISLMQGLVEGHLKPTATLQSHLDHCLGCRSCEPICPTQVPFGRLMDRTRALLNQTAPPPHARQIPKLLSFACHHPVAMARMLRYPLRLFQSLGLKWLGQKSGLFKWLRLENWVYLIPPQTAPFRIPRLSRFFIQSSTSPQKVALFANCMTQMMDPSPLKAAFALLKLAGFEVHIPKHQACCGALHLHAGYPEMAHSFAKQNAFIFEPEGYQHIVTVASGCAATLMENPAASNPSTFKKKIIDVSALLCQSSFLDRAEFRDFPKRVAIHSPCTLCNVQNTPQAVFQLLSRIPKIEVFPFTEQFSCCGAAGLQILEKNPQAQQLLESITAQWDLQKKPIDGIATSNIGCAMHLQRYFTIKGWNIPVFHPVSLLLQQFQTLKTSNSTLKAPR